VDEDFAHCGEATGKRVLKQSKYNGAAKPKSNVAAQNAAMRATSAIARPTVAGLVASGTKLN
jgi:hypothetical protein